MREKKNFIVLIKQFSLLEKELSKGGAVLFYFTKRVLFFLNLTLKEKMYKRLHLNLLISL